MSLFEIISVLVTLSAFFSYLNYRFIGLPTTIGLMAFALLVSLVLASAGPLTDGIENDVRALLASINFDQTLLHGMLSFLLFAGALHVNLSDLRAQAWAVSVLASFSVLASTFMVGGLAWWVFSLFAVDVPLIWCMVFGALISPTDPIAVLGILRHAHAPKALETKISGESLFNDGIAVVVFLAILGVATGQREATVETVLHLFLQEAMGGAVYGAAVGWLVFVMLRSIDNYQVEVLITLALVTGGYAGAEALHLSAPIAIVVAGLLIGNHGRSHALSDESRENLDTFWELVDEILNAVLFVLIGLEVLVLQLRMEYIWATLLLIPLVLLARFVAVGVPIGIMQRYRSFSPRVVSILTWAGLRGGISVAMALSLPAGEVRDALLAVTYGIVVFSILVQGLTVGPLIRASIKTQ